LPVAFQVPGDTRAHVGALEVASEGLSEILPAIDDVSWLMIQPGPGRISQVDWDELDNEEVLIRSAHLARKAVVLQLDSRVSLVIILDDIAWPSKMLWEMGFLHDASKCL
jgi:hypothetical protein